MCFVYSGLHAWMCVCAHGICRDVGGPRVGVVLSYLLVLGTELRLAGLGTNTFCQWVILPVMLALEGP